MASIPAPIRATLGLLATALDTVQELVEHAPELPMEAVGNSMQLSLRLQQQYVALLTRGDEFLANLRGAPEEPPAWATFDESPAQPSDGRDESFSDEADVEDLPSAHLEGEARHAGQGDPLLDAVVTATSPPAEKASKSAVKAAAPRKAAAKKAPPAKAAARKAAPSKLVPAGKAAGKKVAPAKASRAVKANAAKTPAPADELPKAVKVVPAKTAAGGRSVASRSSAPAKRAPRKAAKPSRETEPVPAVPTLDAELDNGLPSARQLSAFDLAVDVDGDAPVADLAAAASPATVALDSPAADDLPSNGSADPSSDAS